MLLNPSPENNLCTVNMHSVPVDATIVESDERFDTQQKHQGHIHRPVILIHMYR